ncbi:unnamed protein product [Closterium sp. Naga37s-1]|nr:unnamed protein product [Closterium sp. Naga37s-1]
MSWFRSALSIGAEAANASGKAVGSGFERASSFASSVVQRANDAVLLAGDAVEQGAKMVYEHAEHAVGGASARQHNSFRHAVRRIEEVAMLARGAERKEALARWLGALAEISAEREQAERGEKELAALQQLGMGLALGGSAAAGGGSDGGGGSGKNDSAEGGAGEAAGQRAAEADGGGGQAGEGAEEGGGEGAGKGAGESDSTSGSGVREGLAPPSASPRRLPAPPSAPPHSKVSRVSEMARVWWVSEMARVWWVSEMARVWWVSEMARVWWVSEMARVWWVIVKAWHGEVLFHDPNAPHQPLTFRDVFLHSQALENMVASLVMDPGDDEEFWLLRNLFRLCLSLGHEDQDALLATLHSLANSAESYAEVKLSGDELERFVAEAMTGLKVSPEAERLDAEARRLEHAVAQGLAAVHASSALHAAEDDGDGGKGGGAQGKGKGEEVGVEGAEQAEGEGGAGEAERAEGEAALGRVEEAERAVDEVLAVQQQEVQAARSREVLRAALRLVALERRREALLQQGDTPGDRALKVERVTSLAAEVGEGVVALRAQMAECTQQKADALAYRTAKAQEAADSHSVVDREMAALQARKAELEEELSKVQSAIDSLSKKQGKVREEKEQFSMASTSIVTHLAAQEARLKASMEEHEGDGRALEEWRKFLQRTWQLQSAALEAQEKRLKEEASARRDRLFAAATSHLHLCQAQLESFWAKAKAVVGTLEGIHEKRAGMVLEGMDAVVADISLRHLHWEERFIAADIQVKRCMGEVELALKDVRAWMDSLASPSPNALTFAMRATSRPTLTTHTPTAAPSLPASAIPVPACPPSEDTARLNALRVRGVELDALLADIRAAPRPALSISHPSVLRVPRISPASPPTATAPAAATAAPAPGATFPATVVIAPVGSASSTLNAPPPAPALGAAGPRRPFKPSLQIGGDAVGGMGGGAPESPEDGAPMTPFVISGGMRRPQGGGFRDEQGRLRRPARKPGVASIAEGVEGLGDKGGVEGGRRSSEVEREEGVVGDGISEGEEAEKADSEAEEKKESAEGKVTW